MAKIRGEKKAKKNRLCLRVCVCLTFICLYLYLCNGDGGGRRISAKHSSAACESMGGVGVWG